MCNKTEMLGMQSKVMRVRSRVSEYKSSVIPRQIYYSIPFLALKMAAAVVHTGPELENKTNCQKRAELSDQAEGLADSGWR